MSNTHKFKLDFLKHTDIYTDVSLCLCNYILSVGFPHIENATTAPNENITSPGKVYVCVCMSVSM